MQRLRFVLDARPGRVGSEGSRALGGYQALQKYSSTQFYDSNRPRIPYYKRALPRAGSSRFSLGRARFEDFSAMIETLRSTPVRCGRHSLVSHFDFRNA